MVLLIGTNLIRSSVIWGIGVVWASWCPITSFFNCLFRFLLLYFACFLGGLLGHFIFKNCLDWFTIAGRGRGFLSYLFCKTLIMLPGACLSLNFFKAEAELPWVQGTFPVGSRLLPGRSRRQAIFFSLFHKLVKVASMDTTDMQNLLALCSHLIIIDRCCHFKIVTTLWHVLCVCFMVSLCFALGSIYLTYFFIFLLFLWFGSWRCIGLLLLFLLTSLYLSEGLRDD